MRKEIVHDGKILAILITKDVATDSITFLTPPEYPIQVGILQHKGGKFVPLHFHNNFHYQVNTTHEILYVERGEITVAITDFNWNEVERCILTTGDMIILMDGGHSVQLNAESRVWEIKQGPYPGDKVAKVFKDNWQGTIPYERMR